MAEDIKVKGLTKGSASLNKVIEKPNLSQSLHRGVCHRHRPAPVQTPTHDDIQEVAPVKAEPGSAAMLPTLDNTGYGAAEQTGAVALEETYTKGNYDYEDYDADGYDDGSGMINLNTHMKICASFSSL